MAYTLTSRQKRLYVHRADIYFPRTPEVRDFGDVGGMSYPPVDKPDFSDVPCYRSTTPDMAVPKFFGRSFPADSPSGMDVFHFPAQIDCPVGTMIRFKMKGHPEDGFWFIVQAESRIKNWRANTNISYVLRSSGPPSDLGA